MELTQQGGATTRRVALRRMTAAVLAVFGLVGVRLGPRCCTCGFRQL